MAVYGSDLRYRLMEPVGGGAMGKVWRAWDGLLNREVAVKEIMLLPGMSDEERADARRRAVREARAAARINHRGVAAVYDMSDEDAEHPWIVMEFVHGRSLAMVIAEDGPLPPSRAAAVGRQVLDALASGHAAGVLHRDLKPGNVLITTDGRAVLTDFGIASVVGEAPVTLPGVLHGTPGFLAPERLRGEAATPASDLWSLGATLNAALAGGDAGALSGIIGTLLSDDPAQRPSAAETRRALDAAVAGKAAPADTLTWDAATAELAVQQTGVVHGHRAAWRLALIAGVVMAMGVAVGIVATAGSGHGHRARHGTARAAVAAVPRPPETKGFRLAAAVNGDGRPELFGVSPDGSLMHLYYSQGAWSGWAALPGGGLSFAGVPAVVRDATGRLEVFARTTGGSIVYLWQATPGGGSWDGPAVLGWNITSDPSVITSNGLEVFARLGDGSAAYNAQAQPGGAWSGWQPLGGSLGGPPAAAVNADGRPEVFAVATDGSLVHDYYWQGTWSGWSPLANPGEFTGVPAVGVNADGRLEVFVRTAAGALEHLWQATPSAGPWDGPEPLGSGVGSDPAVSDQAVAGPDGGQLEVFAELGDGNIGGIRQQPGTGWSQWVSLGGGADSAPAVAGASGSVDVFARTAGGGIGEIQWTGATGWSGWSRLGGSF